MQGGNKMHAKMGILIIFILSYMLFASSLLQLEAGQYIDEFNSAQLNEKYWKVTKAGKGSFEIKDGKLYLISPGVADGIMFYWNKEITNEDLLIEAKIDISGVGTDGTFGFTDVIIEPQVNTDVHPHLNAQFVILIATWGINDDLRGKPDHKGRLFNGSYDKPGGEHIFAVELQGNAIKWYVDGKEVGQSERKAKSRFFTISSDQYTSHYVGTFAIDYIKLSGEGVSAVSSKDKLTTTWGCTKADRS